LGKKELLITIMKKQFQVEDHRNIVGLSLGSKRNNQTSYKSRDALASTTAGWGHYTHFGL